MTTRHHIKHFFIGLLVVAAGVATAATFNLFSPATGVLKGNASTYVTTAAVSSDIRAMWTGSCDATTFLRGDGACAAAASGTVTSVGLTMPSGFSVANSPITTAGTLAVTTTLSGVLKGNGSGFLAAASSDVIALWSGSCTATSFMNGSGACSVVPAGSISGTLSSSNGGTQLNTALDDNIMVGNSATWQSKAVPSCTDTGGNHLNYDTSTNTVSCGTSSSVTAPVGANPTATIGASAVNGVATTFMRSDAAPTLPATLPALSGANLTNLNGSNISTGTVGVPVSTTTGVFSASLTVSGNSVCQSTGTNCPASTTPKMFWARIQSTGTITDTGGYGGASLSSVTKGTTGKYTLNFTGIPSGPACVCSVVQSSAPGYTCQNDAGSGQILIALNSAGTFSTIDVGFHVICTGS